jgi:hypothetical protein
MRCRTATTCPSYSLSIPWEMMVIVKTVPSGSLIFRFLDGTITIVVSRSVGGRYGMGGQLLSWPFSHSASFSPPDFLRMVLILACCQSVVPSMSLLKADLSRTCINWKLSSKHCIAAKLRGEQNPQSLTPNCQFCQFDQLDGPVQKKWFLEKCTACWYKARFCIQSVLSIFLDAGSCGGQ